MLVGLVGFRNFFFLDLKEFHNIIAPDNSELATRNNSKRLSLMNNVVGFKISFFNTKIKIFARICSFFNIKSNAFDAECITHLRNSSRIHSRAVCKWADFLERRNSLKKRTLEKFANVFFIEAQGLHISLYFVLPGETETLLELD